MPQAETTHTTPPTRRRRGAASGPDAELIRAAADVERAAAAPGQTDRHLAQANTALFEAVQTATEATAATDAGLVAKARVLRQEISLFGNSDESAALALALADDLIRLHAAS